MGTSPHHTTVGSVLQDVPQSDDDCLHSPMPVADSAQQCFVGQTVGPWLAACHSCCDIPCRDAHCPMPRPSQHRIMPTALPHCIAPLHCRTAPPLPALTSSGDVLFSYLRQHRDIQGCACPRRCAVMGCKHQCITCGNSTPLPPGLPKLTPWRLCDKLKMVNSIPAAHFAWVYDRLNSYVLSHSTPFCCVSRFSIYLIPQMVCIRLVSQGHKPHMRLWSTQYSSHSIDRKRSWRVGHWQQAHRG